MADVKTKLKEIVIHASNFKGGLRVCLVSKVFNLIED